MDCFVCWGGWGPVHWYGRFGFTSHLCVAFSNYYRWHVLHQRCNVVLYWLHLLFVFIDPQKNDDGDDAWEMGEWRDRGGGNVIRITAEGAEQWAQDKEQKIKIHRWNEPSSQRQSPRQRQQQQQRTKKCEKGTQWQHMLSEDKTNGNNNERRQRRRRRRWWWRWWWWRQESASLASLIYWTNEEKNEKNKAQIFVLCSRSSLVSHCRRSRRHQNGREWSGAQAQAHTHLPQVDSAQNQQLLARAHTYLIFHGTFLYNQTDPPFLPRHRSCVYLLAPNGTNEMRERIHMKILLFYSFLIFSALTPAPPLSLPVRLLVIPRR